MYVVNCDARDRGGDREFRLIGLFRTAHNKIILIITYVCNMSNVCIPYC